MAMPAPTSDKFRCAIIDFFGVNVAVNPGIGVMLLYAPFCLLAGG